MIYYDTPPTNPESSLSKLLGYKPKTRNIGIWRILLNSRLFLAIESLDFRERERECVCVCFFFGEISPLKKGWLNKLLLAVFFLAPWFEFELQITAPFRHSRDEEDEELSSSSSSSVCLQRSCVPRLSESAFGFVLLASKIFQFLRERPSLGVTCLYSFSFYATSSDERESSERKKTTQMILPIGDRKLGCSAWRRSRLSCLECGGDGGNSREDCM